MCSDLGATQCFAFSDLEVILLNSVSIRDGSFDERPATEPPSSRVKTRSPLAMWNWPAVVIHSRLSPRRRPTCARLAKRLAEEVSVTGVNSNWPKGQYILDSFEPWYRPEKRGTAQERKSKRVKNSQMLPGNFPVGRILAAGIPSA
jgi:hypothetical protein